MRGLKLALYLVRLDDVVSHPSWVRGLKLVVLALLIVPYFVAPLVGAWIETDYPIRHPQLPYVAPLVGAWIETKTAHTLASLSKSHPSWVRGLKLQYDSFVRIGVLSHPSWVRGLKLENVGVTKAAWASHPSWVRGLKPTFSLVPTVDVVAPLVGAWIETLLHNYYYFNMCRTPRGCVD